jgi:hypothetical protein
MRSQLSLSAIIGIMAYSSNNIAKFPFSRWGLKMVCDQAKKWPSCPSMATLCARGSVCRENALRLRERFLPSAMGFLKISCLWANRSPPKTWVWWKRTNPRLLLWCKMYLYEIIHNDSARTTQNAAYFCNFILIFQHTLDQGKFRVIYLFHPLIAEFRLSPLSLNWSLPSLL